MKTQRGRVAGLAASMVLAFVGAASAQKSGGVLRIQHMDNPPSASIHEEATVSVPAAFMSVYNNLVLFDQHVPKNSLQSIVRAPVAFARSAGVATPTLDAIETFTVALAAAKGLYTS